MEEQQKVYDFAKDGIQMKANFLDQQTIEKLKIECSNLFSHTQIYGHGYSTRLSKYVSEVPYPTAKVETINLLEVAVDIAAEIEKLGYKNYKLAHLALYHENNNDKELVWHSDMRNGGLIRAQICIEGGGANSGAFRYVKGSQVLKIDEPYPPAGYLELQKDDVIVCDKPNGTLFLFNTIGYHSKCVCNDTRISLMFDFLPEDYIISNPNDVSANVYLTSSRLTDKVVQNINLFRSGVKVDSKSVNTPDYYKFYKPFAGSNLKEIANALKFHLLKKLKRN